jgi:hypothetical protein
LARQYAFVQTAGSLPLRTPTPSQRHVHRTDAIGHKESVNAERRMAGDRL